MTKAEFITRAADRLLALSEEHGTPNNFAPHEMHMGKRRMMIGLWWADIAEEVMRRRPDLVVSYSKNGGFDRATQESRYAWFSVDHAA